MDGFRLPPVIEEVLDPSDELCELKEDKPGMLADTLTAKERESMEEKEEPEGDGEKGQQEEEMEVKERESEEDDQGEEEDLEELRAQVLQLLLELDETREVSQRHEESFMELQGLLDEERLASAHQAESFTRQIQRLQAQLRSAQEEMSSLEEEKESELVEVQQELRSAQEEVLVLQQAAEEAAAERENDIASLQEELCRLRVELQRLHATAAEYELEVTSLSMKSRRTAQSGDVTQLQEEVISLTDERQTLSSNNRELSNKLEQLLQQRDMCGDSYLEVRAEGQTEEEVQLKADSYITLSQSKPQNLDSSAVQDEIRTLKVQLRMAEELALKVQLECEGLKKELEELQQLHEGSQRERAALQLQLQSCKAELQELLGRKLQNCTRPSEPPVLSIPFIGLIVIVALIWCWWEELAS
ncbi:coiled-coil domain-containing protein 136 isoform X1 [Xiphophorus couchianus]|uniref:coiled-coil domain-containing protein 136 isoform X1 n=2 Tax=Xiphophorus couchianus TaxID=32473 RepID=UPI0010164073|nr:coiled-coil domain-containing protein 136 isoform X1 [Xiphophorus couchianus]XP_027900201.1 coiled-coil domain-containing protein 136 isoform X1 [Xiphophorus couchianus]XP_027900202.1 coiled-coil domain-containing protein 136 isoform X1 [Xiphophorus couchianus]XP_027900203.1 coiled-coil domain-containing protein 136 isoform X1 [Xiphophorus couchianus]XP_027900204.1 coiled-coil domain-containing protein 136 isoform X1 [Xiphophorus couchianus]XP_027900205.1 coiled-coil domain-containing prote